MFRYFTSFLGFTNATSIAPASHSYEPAQRVGSCPPWTRPEPGVRLRLTNDTTIRIFGFPRKGSIPSGMFIPFVNIGSNGPPLLHLRGRVPAHVNYIMGDDWRSQLRPDQASETRIFHGGEVILRPTAPGDEDLDAEEQAHCLRMLRCGAFVARAEPDIISIESHGPPELKQLFGWPANGGVWILRSLPIDFPRDGRSEQEELEAEAMMMHLDEVAEEIKQQADMEGVCRILEEAGGQFYEDMEKCPEVVKLGLLE
nr:hypothetical protein CFP56_13358 [Quercus suber]